MASSPRWKVHNANGEYIASCKYIEDAANLVGANGKGSKIRDGRNGGRIVWNEGAEEFSAAESWDGVAVVIGKRLNAIVDARLAKAAA